MSGALGWQARKEKCDYAIKTPELSDDEENVLSEVSSRYANFAKSHEIRGEEEARDCIGKLLSDVLEDESLDADGEQTEYLASVALSHLWGLSFIGTLLSDDSIEEIACIGIGKPVYVYVRAQGWKRTNGYITSQEYFVHLVNKMARSLGRRLSSQTPRLNSVLPDGSRIHASMPPLSHCELTVRKFTAQPITISDLVRFNTVSGDAMAFLWLAMQSDSSVLVAGNTSSGKTTLLGALLSFVPIDERILAIEETPELRIVHPHRIALLSNDELGIGMDELVRDSLRMRPDRVVVGEVRSRNECAAWMETVLSGQARGAYGTFHAQSAQEALRRLRSLGVEESDLPSIDYIVIQRRMALYDAKARHTSEVRRLAGIYCSSNNSQAPTPLFEFSRKTGRLMPSPSLKAHHQTLASRLGLTDSELQKELALRTSFIASLAKKKASFDEECIAIQKFAYGKG